MIYNLDTIERHLVERCRSAVAGDDSGPLTEEERIDAVYLLVKILEKEERGEPL